MNLRHKKPINSYRGQANNDKNEFNDDDFKHQPSPSKKFCGSTGQQMYKYSKILAKFIINANQFYQDRLKNPKKAKTQIQHILEEAKVTRDQSRSSKYAKRVQQPKQKRKIMSKIQNEKLQLKEQKQKQIYKIDSQSKPSKDLIDLQQQKNIPKNIPIKKDVPKPQPPQPKTQIPIKQKPVPIPIPENIMNIYAQGIPMTGFPNPAMFTNMPINQYMGCYEEMMKLSMLQQMIKSQQLKNINFGNLPNIGNIGNLPNFGNMANLGNMGPQYMANMMANADLMNIKQNHYQNYMQNPIQPQMQIQKKNAPIYNLTDVFLTRKESIFNQSKQNPNIMAKRSSIHIGIAYHIYLKELQKKNINTNDPQKIDPTRQSRQIRQRQQGSKKNSKIKSKK